METQKIVNLLNESNNESSKFSTRKWFKKNQQLANEPHKPVIRKF